MFPRRDPDAVIAAHLMDPDRKEVYVEGPSDRLFLTWIVAGEIEANTLIHEIDNVNIPLGPGGARARLLHFAELMNGQQVNILVFVDADYSRVLGNADPLPPVALLTDGRDLEAYYLREECFDKLVNLSLGTNQFTGTELLTALIEIGRELALLRLFSLLNNLNLPFGATDLHRRLTFEPCRLTLDRPGLIRALLNNAGQGHRRMEYVTDGVEQIRAVYLALPDHDLMHGKDLLAMLGRVMQHYGIGKDSAKPILRSTFERGFANESPNLRRVIEFISP